MLKVQFAGDSHGIRSLGQCAEQVYVNGSLVGWNSPTNPGPVFFSVRWKDCSLTYSVMDFMCHHECCEVSQHTSWCFPTPISSVTLYHSYFR